MSSELVCIARFAYAIEAELARARLEVEGIPAFVHNDLGQIELRVPDAAADKALAILDRAPTSVPTAGGPSSYRAEEARCMICQSSFVEVQDYWLPVRLLRAFVLSILPLPARLFESQKRRCGVCGHSWTQSRGDHAA
jgi:hypothetical protein